MENKIFRDWLEENSIHLYNLYEILISSKEIRNVSKEEFTNFIYKNSTRR